MFACPCCGYKTLTSEHRGSYELCPICYWEDDEVQFRNPDYRGGANDESLREAQQYFIKYGGCEKTFKPNVVDHNRYERDSEWRPLD
jgi:hypothetical protein